MDSLYTYRQAARKKFRFIVVRIKCSRIDSQNFLAECYCWPKDFHTTSRPPNDLQSAQEPPHNGRTPTFRVPKDLQTAERPPDFRRTSTQPKFPHTAGGPPHCWGLSYCRRTVWLPEDFQTAEGPSDCRRTVRLLKDRQTAEKPSDCRRTIRLPKDLQTDEDRAASSLRDRFDLLRGMGEGEDYHVLLL